MRPQSFDRGKHEAAAVADPPQEGFNEAAIFRSRKGADSERGPEVDHCFNEAAIFRSRKG